jgi:hypothetical protein
VEQFTGLISPPLFLIISIVIAHGIEMSLDRRPSVGGKARFRSESRNASTARIGKEEFEFRFI